MNLPKLKTVAIYTAATTYHFRVDGKGFGYALCTVNDLTGELSIISDWGNWAHIWGTKHLGCPTLTDFIADRDCYDYLANKLLGRSDCWDLDADATIKAWRHTLAERRLELGQRYARTPACLRDRDFLHPMGERMLTKEAAREMWDEIGDLVDVGDNETLFIERAMQIEGLQDWVCEHPWDDTVHTTSSDYNILTKTILPALAAECGKAVAFRRKFAEAAAS